MPARSIDVFLTYDPRDADLARDVRAAVVAAGMTCWCEAVDLVPGQLWDEEIPARLRTARIVAVLITRHWPISGEANADWYGPEKVALAIDQARESKGEPVIVPVRLSGGTQDRVPYGIRRVAAVDLGEDDPQRLAHELRRVLAHRDGQPMPPAPIPPAPIPSTPIAPTLLDATTLARLVDTYIDHPLDRDLLLSWVPRPVIGTIPRKSTPLEQIEADLTALNRAAAANDELPLASWLRQAIRLAGPWPHARIYAEVLAKLDAKAPR